MADILKTIESVLTSPSARRIDFRLGLMHVDSIGLDVVRNYVALRIVKVKIIAMPRPDMAAQYASFTNTLMFPRADYGATVGEKTTILHECIHAQHDMLGAGYYHPRGGSLFTTKSESEATAYVAGALYFLYETGRTPNNRDAHVVKSNAIAMRIKDLRGSQVTEAEAIDLRKAIVSHPVYNYALDALTDADGL